VQLPRTRNQIQLPLLLLLIVLRDVLQLEFQNLQLSTVPPKIIPEVKLEPVAAEKTLRARSLSLPSGML
jgi:hypothetical protein